MWKYMHQGDNATLKRVRNWYYLLIEGSESEALEKPERKYLHFIKKRRKLNIYETFRGNYYAWLCTHIEYSMCKPNFQNLVKLLNTSAIEIARKNIDKM